MFKDLGEKPMLIQYVKDQRIKNTYMKNIACSERYKCTYNDVSLKIIIVCYLLCNLLEDTSDFISELDALIYVLYNIISNIIASEN